jgi:hypothetical protein
MKKLMIVVVAMVVITSVAMAQNPTYILGSGITGIDKLGAHQNGGRGCVGCHAPHSGARGNGGVYSWDATNKVYVSTAVVGESGNETLWGQDLGPLYTAATLYTGNTGGYTVDMTAAGVAAHPRVLSGVMLCLSCHDGNVAKGAMMTNQSYEQSAGLLPAALYGTQPIPTLLGADEGTAVGGTGNYENDHPIGPSANLGALGQNIYKYFDLNGTKTALVAAAAPPDASYTTFVANYGAPLTYGSRTGAGVVVEGTMTDASAAYVVCTTCHTPHSMYTTSASASNKIAGLSAGTFPTYFFIAAPYNPGANVANGTKASSATQFCRQCHFKGAGGSNEASGINIPTAF